MVQEILNFFIKKGFLLDNEMLDFFNQLEDQEVAGKILSRIEESGEKIITKSLIDKNLGKIGDVFSSLEGEKRKVVERFFVNFSLNIEIKKEKYIEGEQEAEKRVEGHLKIISSSIVPTKKVEVGDFVKNFRNRYVEIKQILQERSELQNLTSLDRINGQKQNLSVVVLISSKRVTKNKNILLEIEDLTGKGLALINHNKPELFEKAQDIIMDEVVGLRLSLIHI